MQGVLTNRERIRRCLLGQSLDRVPYFLFFGPWMETQQRWELEIGGPVDYNRFDFDTGIVSVNQWVNMGFCPAFPYEIIEESDEKIIYQDGLGIIQESIKGKSGIPRIIHNPVKTREDWEQIKAERLDPEHPQRFPDDWPAIANELNKGDAALQLGGFPYGLFGTLRDLMGVENLLLAFYDDPKLVFDIMSDLTDLWIRVYERACQDIKQVELVHMWEDMSGKQGSLISPDMIRTFMTPQYSRIKKFCVSHNISGFIVDTDGRCEELIAPYMEGGINALLPFEVAAGNDVVDLHQRYPGLMLLGGIDKRVLSQGKDLVQAELKRISSLLKKSRYIPGLDHLVPPDVSWQDFCFYTDSLKTLILSSASSE